MPKFIGNTLPGTAATETTTRTLARLSYAQARILQAQGLQIYAELDTTDRGGPRRLAKRWYRWYADAMAVLESAAPTPAMINRAYSAMYTTRSMRSVRCVGRARIMVTHGKRAPYLADVSREDYHWTGGSRCRTTYYGQHSGMSASI